MSGFTGTAQMTAKLNALAARFPQRVARALYQEALVELKEMKRRTPVDTGALRASEEVEEPTISGRDIAVRVTAGGPSAPYALIVHERLDVDHPVGQAKFMESVIHESQPYMAQRIATRLEGLGE